MVVSAAETADPNGRPLSFAWRLLQGDPARVRITPADDGRSAGIEIDWHEPFPISEDNPIVSSRVDIGVFASNGAHDSAPAILSIAFPGHETRVYAPGPDGRPRIASIDHADPARAKTYADPMLMARADWRDDYAYAADGTPLGWTRTRGDLTEDFTPEGARILTRAADGAPLAVEAVSYPLRRDDKGRLTRSRRRVQPSRGSTIRIGAERFSRNRPDDSRFPTARSTVFRARNTQRSGLRIARCRAKARNAASGLVSRGRPVAIHIRTHSASSQ